MRPGAHRLKIMSEWAETAEAALEAEFPSWHLISCFSVFNLESRRADEDKDAVKKCLQKLSQAFKVKLATLLPIAEGLHKEPQKHASLPTCLQKGNVVERAVLGNL